jgi:biotin carboxyl carrier protein
MHRFIATALGAEHQLVLEESADVPGRHSLRIGERALTVDARRLEPGVYSVLVDGNSYLVEVDGASPELTVHLCGESVSVELHDARRKLLAQAGRASGPGEGPQTVRSPMPGKVVKVLVCEGQAIQAGAGVVVVEAMKMENELRAPRDGKVGRIRVQEGQPVESGEELVEIE